MDNLKRNADADSEHDEKQKVKRQRLEEKISKTDNIDLGDKREQVINIIKREFQNEITKRQDEVHLIQQRLLKAQKTLHLLKYVIIKSFYDKKELKLITGEESIINQTAIPTGINNAQNRIHPAIKKLLGKKPIENVCYDFARKRGPSQLPVIVKKEPVEKITEPEEQDTTTLEQEITLPDTNIKETKVPIRNRQKIKHELVIGNISKYVPSNNPQDSSTHKWMVYVRGPRDDPDISHFVKKVRFFLHPSYQPHDIVELEESPFHLSRRGWGEFPLRIQIYFHNSLNKPVDVIHNLKLDQNRTGRQTLGNETLINVWLLDTSLAEENDTESHLKEDNTTEQEINEELFYTLLGKENNIESEAEENNITEKDINEKLHIKKENICISEESTAIREESNVIKEEITENIEQEIEENDEESSSDTETQEQFEPIPGCSKYDPYNFSYIKTSQNNIYPFITPINKSKTENIVKYKTVNNTRIKNDGLPRDYNSIYLVDHCYTNTKIDEFILLNLYAEEENFIDREKYKIKIPFNNFTSIRQTVYFLFKSLPLVTKLANDPSYKCSYPYVASTVEEFCSWNYAKRCCSEWYRAKYIKKMLQDNKIEDKEEWSIKFIIMFGRAHAFTPLANYEIFQNKTESGKTLPNEIIDSEVESTLTECIPIADLMENSYNTKDKDEECYIDVEGFSEETIEIKVEKKIQRKSSETDTNLLPLCNYIKNCAGQIEVNLEDEEIEPGIFHNSAERVMLQSVMCLAEELIRTAWANKVIGRKGRNLECRIEKRDIFKVLLEREEFDIFTNVGLGKAIT